MDLFNTIIWEIDKAGLRNDAYSLINTVSLCIAVIIGICHGRKLRVGWIPILFSIAIERALAGSLMNLILYVENGFVSTGVQNGVVVFPYVPLLGFVFAKILKKSWKEIWDVMIPVPLMMFAGARMACTITGCCRGYPCDWGIYNGKVQEYLFPIQLLESLVSILILVIVIRREKINRYVSDGRNVPIILILYGVARFFLEFLHDNQKNALGLASTQFHCLLMILVGVITIIIIKHSEKVVSQPLVEI